jgi:chromosome segregation ATPase
MSDESDFQLIVEQAKRFSEQFGALITVGNKLAEIGDLRHAESEAQQALARVQRELDVLNSERGAAYQKVHDAIEAGLKHRYQEHERLLSTESTLRVSVRGLEEKRAELQGKLSDLERRIAQGEARYADVTGKLSGLRQSLDR